MINTKLQNQSDDNRDDLTSLVEDVMAFSGTLRDMFQFHNHAENLRHDLDTFFAAYPLTIGQIEALKVHTGPSSRTDFRNAAAKDYSPDAVSALVHHHLVDPVGKATGVMQMASVFFGGTMPADDLITYMHKQSQILEDMGHNLGLITSDRNAGPALTSLKEALPLLKKRLDDIILKAHQAFGHTETQIAKMRRLGLSKTTEGCEHISKVSPQVWHGCSAAP